MHAEPTLPPGRVDAEATSVKVRVRNEFAMVELAVVQGRTGDRVRIRDVETGTAIELDALQLEALTRVEHERFGPLIVDRFPADPMEP